MSMQINNNYSGCTNTAYGGKKTAENNAAESDSAKESNITTSTVELKTSTPGVTKTEQIKTGFKTVNDYSKYLQNKYSYMNTGTTSMQGVPTTVSVSSAFLKKCKSDPEKAKYLEENLAALPDCAKMAVNMCSGTLTSLSYQIDAKGNITCISSGSSDPDGKIAKENAARKAKEEKAEEKKAAQRREEKKAEEEKEAKRRAKKNASQRAGEYTVSAVGSDTEAVTQKVIAASLGISAPTGAGFDIKA